MIAKWIDILSELATDVRAHSIDDYISYRYLQKKFISKMEYLLRLESKSSEIYNNVSDWESINCLEFIDVPTNSCGVFDGCNQLKRSVDKVTDIFDTSTGKSILVFDIAGRVKFDVISLIDFGEFTKRRYYPKNKIIFWLHDDYLWTPNDIEAVKVFLIRRTGTNSDSTGKCNLALQNTINYPSYLVTLAKTEVLKEISGVYKRIVEDEKGDNNTNIK